MNRWSEFTWGLAPTGHSNIDREMGGRAGLGEFSTFEKTRGPSTAQNC